MVGLLVFLVGLSWLQPAIANDNEPAGVPVPTPNGPAIPITLDLPTSGLYLTLDPALATTPESLTAVEALFLGLTDIDPITGDISPELAYEWNVSDDGLEWTFYLRDDVNWFQYNSSMETATLIRPVIANDVVFGIKRACDPTVAAPNGGLLAEIIAGCDVVYQTMQVGVTNELATNEDVEVYAPDDTTVVIKLQRPISYFLAITTLAAMRPVPTEIIESYGLNWTQPNHIISNGTYFLNENDPSQYRVFIRNHSIPADLQHGGNIERVVYHVIPDRGSHLSLYNDNVLDQSSITSINLQSILNDPLYTNEVVRLFDISVYYFGFDHQSPPFNDPRVRRAFTAILDRQAFLNRLNDERGIPLDRFTPPGHQPSGDTEVVGLRYDIRYAREQMALAGYPNCNNFPVITMMTFRYATEWGNFLADAAIEYLGCDPTAFEVIPVVNTIFGPDIRSANIWTGIWKPVYPDVHAWIGEGIWCEGQNMLHRSCTDIDRRILDAAVESDPNVRSRMYASIEAQLFGHFGDMPLTPIFVEAGAFILVKPWLHGPFSTDGTYGPSHWDAYSIDMSQKLANRKDE
jgi:ABC-type oligopeptide transport system substrate-binding subunit